MLNLEFQNKYKNIFQDYHFLYNVQNAESMITKVLKCTLTKNFDKEKGNYLLVFF